MLEKVINQHDVMIVVAQYALPELDQLATAAPADGDGRFTGQSKLRQVMTTVYFCSTLNPFEKHAKMTSIDVDLNHGSDIKDIWDVFSYSSSRVLALSGIKSTIQQRHLTSWISKNRL